MKNFYLHRNYSGPPSNVGSWSQGFDLKFVSGYTDTPLEVGLDIDAQYALKLDSAGNDGSLPYSETAGKASDASRAGVTAKFKYSNTELKIGDFRPRLPVAWFDPSRQLETIYQGAVVESNEIDGLNIMTGSFWSAATRASSNHEKFSLSGPPESPESSGLDFAGFSYKITPTLEASYYFGLMHDLYRQHYAGLSHFADLGNGFNLKTDARFWQSIDEGRAKGGNIDNKTYGLQFTVTKGYHLFGLGYQQLEGESGFPTLSGYIPNLHMVNWSYTVFAFADERSWTTRYAYDFGGVGIPGLKMGARFTKGTHWDLGQGQGNNQQTERILFANYVVQSGELKNLSFDARTILARYEKGANFSELRLTTTYPLNVW
ncbi:OprD family porin [Pseudomonas sp. RGM2987]|nr:OprD family porin [Pseudomonas sp. RGM2987]